MTKQQQKITAIASNLLDWFARDARDLPWRRTRDPYAIWVSEVMLQQTQVKTVIPYWERWMQAMPTIASAAAASSDQIHKLWEGLGYYTRVRNLQKAAQVIVEQHGGKFPEQFDEILALPGIGRYTAGAVCSIAFNQATPILDGNVIRVLTRLFAIEENPKDKETNERLWKLAGELVKGAVESKDATSPRPSPPFGMAEREKARQSDGLNHSHAQSRSETGAPAATAAAAQAPRPVPRASFLNQSLMELGALICSPRQPQCLICPVQGCCEAYRQQRTEELPHLSDVVPMTARQFMAFVVESRGEVFVRQRPSGVVNAHLWEFPNMECALRNMDPKEIFRSIFHVAPKTLKPLCVVKHSITRYRMTLTAYQVTIARRMPNWTGKWVKVDKLSHLAFAAAHKKVVGAVRELFDTAVGK